ncbi:hypothetical protein CHK_2103 [Christensenella hongkongensis]|uniref:Uncharacterized protein n=1 Tax=Christensenella hongkongensis TaxID=270498 RepID=A0A0M2NIG5_9FIRM|nr:hypothetical protein CHK_2103 [Christensenella hongkongensis]
MIITVLSRQRFRFRREKITAWRRIAARIARMKMLAGQSRPARGGKSVLPRG